MGQTTIDTSVLEALLAEDQEEENKTRENTQPFTGEETFEQGGYYPNPGFDNITSGWKLLSWKKSSLTLLS
jgi:hypothetical protein